MKQRILFFAVLALMLASCKQKQPVVKPVTVNPTASIVERVLTSQPKFNTASAAKAKLTVDYQQRKISTNATISMITDSAIVVSVQPFLGMEMLRVELDKTKIVLIDKLNRRYTSQTFAELQRRLALPITFSDVEALLTDRLFAIGHDRQWLLTTPLELTQGQPELLSFATNQLTQSFAIDPASSIIESAVVTLADNRVLATYTDYRNFSEVYFPSIVTLDLAVGALSGKAVINLGEVKFNTKVNVAPSATDKLKKVSLSTILPM
ncbi:MAG: DUF4292 domain-containing protein [Paludibacteraceae bacterium]|nr:DUF4292 domain-containing protein [Paludibacteraceae bacterium]